MAGQREQCSREPKRLEENRRRAE